MTPQQLFENIVAVCPAFRPVVAEHLKDFDVLLSHLLMADLLRFVGSGFGTATNLGVDAPTEEDIQRILAVLEDAFTVGNDLTVNTIAVSFVEYLDTEPFFIRLEPMLGTALRDELQRQNEF